MANNHRGESVSGNTPRISRAARRDINRLTNMTNGNFGAIPEGVAKNFVDTHGPEAVSPLIRAMTAHGVRQRQVEARQQARRQALSNMTNAIIGRVAPFRATAFEVERRYGGPEEGGWWYDAGTPVAHSRPFLTEGGARRAASRMESEFPTTGSRSSVRNMRDSDMFRADSDSGADMYDYESGREYQMGGYNPAYDPDADYEVEVQRGKGKPYPGQRPYYE